MSASDAVEARMRAKRPLDEAPAANEPDDDDPVEEDDEDEPE